MLSKSQISFIRSLHQKKYRKEHGLFLVEGLKSITEFLQSSYQIESIYTINTTAAKVLKIPHKINVTEIGTSELSRISTLQNPQDALAVLRMPVNTAPPFLGDKKSFALALDGVQDPGNLGTIIRTADWFGIEHIICSEDTVEAWNPKTVQSTMGSLARVNISYTSLEKYLGKISMPVYGTLLEGSSLYDTKFEAAGIFLLGSEGRGISPQLQPFISQAITIPRVGRAESLNVAVAAAICCAELVRQSVK